jgi:hypothetical protein
MKRRGIALVPAALLLVLAALPCEAQASAPADRMAGALALVEVRALAAYGFSADQWPSLGVTPWPVVTWCLAGSTLAGPLADMDAALNRQDIPSAFRTAESIALAARDVGLGVTAIGIAETVASYAEQAGDEATRARMAALVRELEIRRGATPEYSAQGVPAWFAALKPQTLFVGTNEAVRALGVAGVQARFANMLEIVGQDMARTRDLRSCRFHPEAPDHLLRDYWVLIQRLRVDAGKLACLAAAGSFDPVVAQVSYFNGSWGLVREIALSAGCSTRGVSATWK